ncbi:MAG: two-component regulator propeller domain-containing protein [Candidatus Dadabacteria bacterium]
MKKFALIAIISLALLVLTTGTFSQEIFFNKVLPPEGNPFFCVTGIVQDKSGYMWFASLNGLFRYDGYEMKLIKVNPADPNSLANDAALAIAVDSSGMLWIAVAPYLGIDRFDPSSGIVTHFRHNQKDSGTIAADGVNAFLVDREGTVWIGTNKGLDRFDRRTGKFIHYKYRKDDFSTISNNRVLALYEDRAGKLWIGTGSVWEGGKDEGGLNLMDKKTGKFIRYLHDPKDPNTLINNKVSAMCEDSKGNFWVGTAEDGLHTMDRRTGAFQRYPYNPAHPEKLSRPPLSKKYREVDRISFIKEDGFGALWIGTSESGINYYNPEKKSIIHYESQKDIVGGYEDRTSSCAYISRDGVLWISSLHGNLYRTNTTELPYYKLPQGVVNSFYEDRDGTLWMATNQGLLLQTSKGKKIKMFAGKEVITLKEDRSGRLLILTTKGLYSFDRTRKIITKYPFDSKTDSILTRDPIMSVCEDSTGNLWIGTFTGLYQLNRKTGKFIHYLFFRPDSSRPGLNAVNSLLADRYGSIWAGSQFFEGLQQLDPLTGNFKTYLQRNEAFSLYEDKSGTLWVGSRQGFYRYDRNKRIFRSFIDSTSIRRIRDVRQIIEDDQTNLWVYTDVNIFFKINPERNQCTKVFQNSGDLPWLPWRSAYKGHDGKLYFSTSRGYHAFFPDQLRSLLKPPEILISEFHLSNHLVLPRSNGPLTEPVSLAKTIRLNHRQNIFSFAFTSIDFTNPKGNQLHFKLDNYDNDWNQAGSDRRAVYFNVPPGNYIFRVKTVNTNGLSAERKTNIIIIPPWWSRWWFRIPALIIGIGLFYILFSWRLHQKQNSLLEKHKAVEQERTRISMEIHDDLGSGLTSIMYMTTSLNADVTPASQEKISKIVSSTNELIQNMNDIVWTMKTDNNQVAETLSYIRKNAAEQLEYSGIHYEFDFPEISSFELTNEQKRNLILISKEAVHNIIKHSQATIVHLRASTENNCFYLAISDNGRGFTENMLQNTGNGLRNMKERAREMGGSLVVNNHIGTTITLSLLLPHSLNG